ncbi:MAG: UPF0182 family protein [Candidatus Limnocylindrus sp.]
MSDPFKDFLEELERRRGGEPNAASSAEGDDAGAPPRSPRARRPAGFGGAPRGSRRRLGFTAIIGPAILVVLLVGGPLVGLLTDARWFDSLGAGALFWQRLQIQGSLLAVAGLVALAFLIFNLIVAGALSRGSGAPTPGDATGARPARPSLVDEDGNVRVDSVAEFLRGIFGGGLSAARGGSSIGAIGSGVLRIVAVLAALLIALRVAGSWEAITLFRNAVPFDPSGAVTADPVFGRDISFYLFDLPVQRLLQGVVILLLTAALLIAALRYLPLLGARGFSGIGTGPRLHIALIGAGLLVATAFGYQLDKLELVYSSSGVATGVSYTDFAARIPGLDVLTAIAAIAAALLVGAALTRATWPLALTVFVWLGASFVLTGIYPEFVQRFQVLPNEYALEQPYIANNIKMTRLAYGIDSWAERQYDGEVPLTAAAIADNAETFADARLWDYRPLQATLDQLQTVRQYYNVADVDVDRYPIAGRQRLVMLSARELNPNRALQSATWVNRRIAFTHGIGVAMVPVSGIASGGLPQLTIREIPPVSTDGAPVVSEPRIYFGELDDDWVVVGAKTPEFDYPLSGDTTATDPAAGQDATTSWTGTGGISLGTFVDRLLFAARLGDLNLLISDQVTANSQLLWRRTVQERIAALAPFVQWDADPYLVIRDDGGLSYMVDGYTTSSSFPNAQAFDADSLPVSGVHGAVNYLRNSVKATIDLYSGETRIYIANPADPIARTWSKVFPGLLRPIDEMPADLLSHLRVGEDGFDIATRVYARYHVTDPQTFYRQDDVWTVPEASTGTQSLPGEAYYVRVRLPGEAAAEFALIQPMVPTSRPNMIAWIAARNDGASYGQVVSYRFPKDTSVFGPSQVSARIDADPIIASQTTLWDQSGSTVTRGNLIVAPIGGTIVYLQPVYLQSTASKFPEFQKVVAATSTKVVWGDTLSEALNLLVGGGVVDPGTGGAEPKDVAGLVARASQLFAQAQDALRAGDFASYGQRIAELDKVLATLADLTGAATP